MKDIFMNSVHSTVGNKTASVVLLLAAASSSARAGIPSVVLEPTSTAAIPTLTPIMLVFSAAFLAVIALRTLRKAPAAQRIVSAAALAVGLGTAALHLSPTQADIPGLVFSVDPAECDASQVVVGIDNPEGPPAEEFPGNTIDNTCPADLRIEEYRAFSCLGAFNDNGSPLGTIIPAGEERPIGFCEGDGLIPIDDDQPLPLG